jgi:hypothetical protein
MTSKPILNLDQLIVLLKKSKTAVPSDSVVSISSDRGGFGDSFIVLENPDRSYPMLLIMCNDESVKSQQSDCPELTIPYAQSPLTLTEEDMKDPLKEALKEVWDMASSRDANIYPNRTLQKIRIRCKEILES